MSVLAFGQSYGRVPHRWTADSLALSPIIHEHERVNVAHAHEAAFVSLMLAGEYVETAAQHSVCYDRFTAVYHPAGLEHQDVIGISGVRLLMFEFQPGLLDGLDFCRNAMRAVRDLSGSRAAWQLITLYRDAARQGIDALDFESRAMQVIVNVLRLARKVPRDQPSLRRAREYLHAHYQERVMMRDVAEAVGIHRVYLGQMFHREVGETIGNYLTRLRVRAAAEQLTTTTIPLAIVALEHGFYDQSHFNRIFKRLSGVTPAAFRAQFGSSE